MLTLTLDTMRRLLGAASRGVHRSSRFAHSRAYHPERAPGYDLIYKMKAWPRLPESGRTAEIYRMLSVMSSRPVNRQWLLARTRMHPEQLDQLLRRLVAEGAIEVIDPSHFSGREALQA